MRLRVVLLAAVLTSPARADLGFCDKMLEYIVRSYVSEATRKDFGMGARAAAYDSLCPMFQKAAKGKDADRRQAFEAVGGEGKYDSAKFDKLKKAYCTLARSIAEEQAAYQKTASALKPKAMTEWKHCTEAEKGEYGPPMEIEQIDDFILSFTLKPGERDLRSVRIKFDGFRKCSGFLQWNKPSEKGTLVEVPVLPKGREADLACFREAKKPPCGTEAAGPAHLTLEFEDGGRKVKHQFDLVRVMSTQCPLPASP
ncbi:MAG: hypothetical protein ACJ79M_14900 [Myxococcales bacterium]